MLKIMLLPLSVGWYSTFSVIHNINVACFNFTDLAEEFMKWLSDSIDHVLGRVSVSGKKTKKPKRRPISSGESEDGEDGRWGRRRRRRRRRESSQASSHLDDGDEELFQLRML